ncbi:glycoside hydrolase family 88/105 protein [Phnomibacter ginsenosidimutans]|nr:glycoside hydrolase family 88 protein [Phnomibacter ginsenosidimutans]
MITRWTNTQAYVVATMIAVVLSMACGHTQKATQTAAAQQQVLQLIHLVNNNWQQTHQPTVNAFWDNAAYHTGNMEVYALTKHEPYREYSTQWATHNQWKGAKSDDISKWKLTYGETDEYVLFGDWQICFQTYIDLYKLQPDESKIARAKQVMQYQIQTPRNDYWWWSDGLYMVMPVMTKMYSITKEPLYLEKLYSYLQFADSIMYDDSEGLYFRDARYVYPKHKTASGGKDFWSRGNGWVVAGLAKLLQDLPAQDAHRLFYENKLKSMAAALKKCQHADGYWTRSLTDEKQSPGFETSGTAFFTYGILWGINHGLLSKVEYGPVVEKAWQALTTTAVQPNGTIGYVQPIGERAIPGQIVDKNSTANFGVGAWLLAACEMYRYLGKK